MKTQLDGEDCKELLQLLINQTISDYIHFFCPKDRKQRKALYTAEAFLFDDDYYVDWGEGIEYNLNDMLMLVNEKDRQPINITLMREAIKAQAYQHNFVDDKIKKNSQLRLDFLGVLDDNT